MRCANGLCLRVEIVTLESPTSQNLGRNLSRIESEPTEIGDDLADLYGASEKIDATHKVSSAPLLSRNTLGRTIRENNTNDGEENIGRV